MAIGGKGRVPKSLSLMSMYVACASKLFSNNSFTPQIAIPTKRQEEERMSVSEVEKTRGEERKRRERDREIHTNTKREREGEGERVRERERDYLHDSG